MSRAAPIDQDDLGQPQRVKCPQCMGFLEDVLLKELPEHLHERAGQVVAIGGVVLNKVLRFRAIGTCRVHGLVTTKA